ncbi:hypothetical protein ACSX1C_06615 [Pseudomonas sp. MBLB4123]|uniref:hypothetical protein n=1 Tax=Pseudomonas sp. MBLB4123 TaxID=3451557 RepID=UPI003F74B431
MKVRLLVCGGLLLAVFSVFWIYGNSLIAVGERESRWVLWDMWGVSYFNVRALDIEEHERMNLLSLQEGSSKNQELITYVVRNRCKDDSERCYLIMTSASNLLIDGADYDTGLKGAVEAISRVKDASICPVAYESAILKYKIKTLSSRSIDSARSASRRIIEKIKLEGGLMKSLKTKSCISLLKRNPNFFHEYALLIAHVMGFAGGDFAKAGAYINSSVK